MPRKKKIAQILVQSNSAVEEALRLSNQSEEEIARDYLNYPMVPINQTLRIDKIGIINFNCFTKEKLGNLTYGAFRKLDPELFFPCKDPKLDYEDHEQVAPAVIISGDQKYRVDQLLWYPLSDIIVDIIKTQGRTGRKLLPVEVFIDENNQWMVPLFNLTRM